MPVLVRNIDTDDMVKLITFERKPMLVHRVLLRNMSDTEHTYQNYLPDTHVLVKDQSRIIRLLREV